MSSKVCNKEYLGDPLGPKENYQCASLRLTRDEFFCSTHQVHLRWITQPHTENEGYQKHPFRCPDCTTKVFKPSN